MKIQWGVEQETPATEQITLFLFTVTSNNSWASFVYGKFKTNVQRLKKYEN